MTRRAHQLITILPLTNQPNRMKRHESPRQLVSVSVVHYASSQLFNVFMDRTDRIIVYSDQVSSSGVRTIINTHGERGVISAEVARRGASVHAPLSAAPGLER